MKKFLTIALLIISMVVCATMILPRLQSTESPARPAAVVVSPEAALLEVVPPTATEAPTPQPVHIEAPPESKAGSDFYSLSLYIPERMQSGTQVDAWVSLVGWGDVAELYLEIEFPIIHLFIVDDDPATPGSRVTPLIGPPAVVELNEADAMGLLRFKVRDLVDTGALERGLFSMRLQVGAPTHGVLPVGFLTMRLLDVQGAELMAVAQAAFVEVVTEPVDLSAMATPPSAPTAAPLPEATPEPTVDPTTQPTPEPTFEPTVEPTALVVSGGITPGIYYRLQRGQTLYQVAEAFGSTPEAIAQANGITDVTRIPVNMLLRVPVAPPQGQAAYFIAPRETLNSIAQTFGFTAQELAALNGIPAPYAIQAGRWLILQP